MTPYRKQLAEVPQGSQALQIIAGAGFLAIGSALEWGLPAVLIAIGLISIIDVWLDRFLEKEEEE